MHHHGYLWTGPKQRFDQEALRRPPYPEPPPAGSRPELIQRYREVAAGFPASELPPLETAYWLLKPRSLVRGPDFVDLAAERLASGGDVSLGCYLEPPSYLSLAVVTCSPNRARPELPCPLLSFTPG